MDSGGLVDNRLLRFARLAVSVARRVLPDRSCKYASGLCTQPQLLACLLFKEHLKLTYRRAQELLELTGPIRKAFGLKAVPDHSTLWWFARRKLEPELLRRALA